MKLLLYSLVILQVIVLNKPALGFLIKKYDAIFYENVKYKGILNQVDSLKFYLLYKRNFFLVLGSFLAVNFASNNCVELSNRWKNRISSISTKICVNLYTQDNCQSDKATLSKDKIYFKDNLNNGFAISSYNLYGTW